MQKSNTGYYALFSGTKAASGNLWYFLSPEGRLEAVSLTCRDTGTGDGRPLGDGVRWQRQHSSELQLERSAGFASRDRLSVESIHHHRHHHIRLM